MRISTLALANLRRRKLKAAFLAVGIALGVGTVVALTGLGGSIQREIGTQMDRYGANIVIVPKGDSLALDYGGVQVSTVAIDARELHDRDVDAAKAIAYGNRLSAVAPKLLGAADIEGRQVMLAGVRFKEERVMKPWWRVEGRMPENGDELLLGAEAAAALGVTDAPAVPAGDHDHASMDMSGDMPGMTMPKPVEAPQEDRPLLRDALTVAGEKMTVAGVLAPTGGTEDRMVFASLDTVQRLLKQPGRLSVIEVSALCKDCPIDDIVGQLAVQLPDAKVSAVQQAVRAREQTVGQLGKFSAVVAIVVLVIVGLLTFTTMTGAVAERTKEIGVLRAIGFRRSHVALGLGIEVAVVSVLGGLLGWAAGTAAAWGALPWFAQAEVALVPQPGLILPTLAGALLIGLLASWYPIRRAARLDPVEAVRYA